MSNQPFRRFHNALRILMNIDRDEFEKATGYTDDYLLGSRKTRDDVWSAFRDNPWRWIIQADEQGALGIWQLIEQRQRLPDPYKANARLIAAAPEMLEALKWAESALAPFSKEPAEKSGIIMIRAAIAKAEGRDD